MVVIYSKSNISADLKEKIIKAVKDLDPSLKKKDEFEFKIDPSIISGIKVSINSKVIDLTINNRLEKIFEKLSNI